MNVHINVSLTIIISYFFYVSSKIIPGDYLSYDSNFLDENTNEFEKYHYIIDARAANNGYIDEYSGVYYTTLYCLYYSSSSNYGSRTSILSGIDDSYKKKTRLLGLISYGCGSSAINYYSYNNFPIYIKRQDTNVSYSAIFRLANNFKYELNISLGVCNGTSYSTSSCAVRTSLHVPPKGFIKYHIKWDEYNIYFKGEGESGFYHREQRVTNTAFIVVYTSDPRPTTGQIPVLWITSVLLRAEMFKYKLTISGDRMNFCYNYACLSSTYYYACSLSSGSGPSYCYYSYSKETCDLRGCVPGAYCDSSNNLYLCRECDVRCRTCVNTEPTGCMSCHNTAVAPQWYSYSQNTGKLTCIHEYIALNNFNTFEVQIPLLLNYRGTIEFWVFIVNPQKLTDASLKPSYSSFILKNFFTVFLKRNELDISNVDITLIPFENIYPFNKNIINDDTFIKYYASRYIHYQHVSKTFSGITSRWFFVRAGFSYTHKKMYVNEYENKIDYPRFYVDDTTTYQSFMRTFFRKNEKGILRVQGFEYIGTDLYIRNFNCYSDYINFYINSPNYYNMHTVDLLYVPALLFVIPFNDIEISATSTSSTFKMYDYSNQFTNTNNQVITSTVTFQFIPTNLAPSKNFRRIKFLNGGENKYYTTTDLSTTSNLRCVTTSGLKYCYEDNLPYGCQFYYNLFLYIDYTTITNYPVEEEEEEQEEQEEQVQEQEESGEEEEEEQVKEEWIPEYLTEPRCMNECRYPNLEGTGYVEYMRLPSIKINKNTNKPISTHLCNYRCDEKVAFCPYKADTSSGDSISYMQKFQCKSGYTTLFYQCLDENEYNVDHSALQFSGTYRTKSIYFPLIKDGETPISNYMVEMWFHPDLLTQPNPPLYKQFIFMSDTSQIYFDYELQQYVLKTLTNGFYSINELGFNIYYYGWNHLILISKPKIVNAARYTEFNVSVANSFSNVDLVSGTNTISKICFCNIDENCCGTESNALWFDMFIKDIKLWDARFVGPFTLFDFGKFNYVIPGGLVHWYKLDIQHLNNDVIKCKVDDTYQATFPFDNYFLNPYNDQNFNYGMNYNWNDFHYPKFIIGTLINTEKNIVNITTKGECNEGCSQCFGDSKHNCFNCQENYALNGASCILNSQYDAYFYYINPLHESDDPSDNNDEFELDFSSLDLDTHPGLTIFFYLKLYGFTIEQTNNYKTTGNPIFDIIYFTKDKSFKLSYDADEESLKLIINNEVQFKFKDFSKKLAQWIPISISAFRALDITLQKHFASMTVDTTPLEYHYSDFSVKEYKKFNFQTFIFCRTMIGHVTDVTLFKSFIINAMGYATHKDNPDSLFTDININPNSLDLILGTFPLKFKRTPEKIYDSKGNITGVSSWPHTTIDCLENTLYLENTNMNIRSRVKCAEDYITYTDQNCNDNEFVKFNTQNLPPSCVADVSKCPGITQLLLQTANCEYFYSTCDNWSVNSIKNLIFLYEKSSSLYYIICGSANGLDIARYKQNSVPNILSPTEQFKMEFWFLSQSYVNNNFREIVIDWEGHIKITANYDPIERKYKAKCNGLNSVNNQVSFSYSSTLIKDNKWRYVVCGVDIPNNEQYITNLQKENQGADYRKNLVDINVPTSDLTTLTISENSPTNFGVTYIKELRLWSCYDCSSDRAFVFFNRDDPFFEKVLHYFKFEDPAGLLKDYRNNIYVGDDNVQVQFETKDDFNGYGLLLSIPDAPNCNEGGSLYYSIKISDGCDIFFNFNKFKEDVVFPNIPASRSNRYTMEFWFYIESPDNFLKGFNIIYEEHIAISTYAKELTDTDITVYCFPQVYRNNPWNYFGEDILKKFNVAQNKVSYTYSNAYSKWNYVRCAYSYDAQKYYINNEPEQNVEGEIFFSIPNNKQNEKSFKMFMKNLVRIIMNTSRDNFVRIFYQSLNVYREYIPQEIETKYMKMSEYIVSISKNYYYPLLFSVDFPKDYNIIINVLYYHITDYDWIPTTEQVLLDFMSGVYDHSYTTYPIYDPFLQCGIGKIYKLDSDNIPYCDYISVPDNCNNENIFCLDNNKLFWCPKNQYLNVQSLTCNEDCPAGYTRPPDIVDGYGMCSIKASDLHYSTFPNTKSELAMGQYEEKFSCDTGYTLVNYHCVRTTSNSAIYFSSKYYFTNTIASFNKFLIKNYYVDFWIMFDMTETYRYSAETLESDTNRYHIFIAFPHIITRYNKYIQYTNGYVVNQITNVTTIDRLLYKWNHIIIENFAVEGENLASSYKQVSIFINNDYENPAMSLQIKNNNDFSLCQIAFCSGANDKWATCVLGLNSGNYKVYQDIIWEDAYYKQISVWNAESTGINSINTFGTPLNNELTMNVIAYYPFNVESIKNGRIESLLLYNGNNVDFTFVYNTEVEYDHSSQINWVNNFDVTVPNKYISSIDNSGYENKDKTPYFSLTSNSYNIETCSNFCYKCFTEGSNSCINCQGGYLLEGKKCISPTNYYFKTPVDNSNTDPIQINFDFSSYSEITIMFYMKFMGTVNIRDGIIPLIYFYNTDNYFAWDNDINKFIIIYKKNDEDVILYKYKNSRVAIGKWTLFSISIYNSQSPGIFPNMIQFMVDDITQPAEINIETLKRETILYNKISMSNIVSALYYDLRIYNKFFIGAYALAQDYEANTEPHLTYLKKRLKFNSIDFGFDCLSVSEVNVTLGTTAYCIGDVNLYDDTNNICNGDSTNDKFRIINYITQTITCETCNTYCKSKCYSNDIQGCLCSYDTEQYLLRYIESANIDDNQKMYYCQKPEGLNLNEYNNIKLNNIKIGDSLSYQIEFWTYIYSYIKNDNFRGGKIEWTHFTRIDISINSQDDSYIDIICYPYSDELRHEIKEEKKYKFNEWIFIRCIVDKDNLVLTLNDKTSNITTEIVNDLNRKQPSSGTTNLIMQDYYTNKAYGLFIIRELRIWDTKTTLFYDTARVNLAIDDTYPNLAHYFKNFYEDNLNRKYIFDDKNQIRIDLNDTLISPYPYSFVPENYIELVLCSEGETYKLNDITNVYECALYESDDIVKSLQHDNSILSPQDLNSKTSLILDMAINGYSNLYSLNNILFTEVNTNENGEYEYIDPEISTTFCSNNGYIRIVDHTPTCYCYGDYVGKYCQLDVKDYANINEVYNIFLTKAKDTFNKYKDNTLGVKKIKSALSNILKGIEYFSHESSIITDFVDWFSTSIIYKVDECDIEYIKLVDQLFSVNIDLTNYYKVGNMVNGKGTTRNSQLSFAQQSIVNTDSIQLKRMLEYLTSLCFLSCVDNQWNYNSKNLEVNLIQVTNNFNIDSFVKEKKENLYLPYFQIGNCLNEVKKSTSGTLNLQFITWYYSSYYYNPDLYWNYISHYLKVKIYNEELSEVPINSCSESNKIEFYLTLFNPFMVEILNNHRWHFYAENMYPSDAPIFSNPKYIDSKGNIDHSTREERIKKYYYEYILEFNTLNAKDLSYSSDGLTYEGILDNNYLKGTSNHLSEFILNYVYNPYPTKEDGRLFFLTRFNLYKNGKNYKGNYGFYLLLFILILYFVNFFFCKFRNRKKLSELENIRYKFINLFLLLYVYPYGTVESDFVVNKETGNKIYNEEYENLDSKALSQQEKLDIISVNKLKGKKGKKNRKLTLNKNYNINLGDVKSKKLYDNYFGQMKNEQDDLSQSLETKEQFKKKFTENESQDIKI